MNLEVPCDTLEENPKHQALEYQHYADPQAQVKEDPVTLVCIGLDLKALCRLEKRQQSHHQGMASHAFPHCAHCGAGDNGGYGDRLARPSVRGADRKCRPPTKRIDRLIQWGVVPV